MAKRYVAGPLLSITDRHLQPEQQWNVGACNSRARAPPPTLRMRNALHGKSCISDHWYY